MQAKHIMSEDIAYCTPGTNLREAALIMAERDCGALPVIDVRETSKPIGLITDRDIACRAVAFGLDPENTSVEECMSTPVLCVSPETSTDECITTMADNRIRRVVVVDADGCCCGMVAQADIARSASSEAIARVVAQVSQPGSSPTGDATVAHVGHQTERLTQQPERSARDRRAL